MLIRYLFLSAFALSFLFLSSCDNEKKAKPITDLEIIRFDKILMELDTTDIVKSFSLVKEKYPNFTEIYFTEVFTLPGYQEDSELFYTYLKVFINDKRIKDIYAKMQEQYEDLADIEQDLALAFDKSTVFFPDLKAPVIYTYLSEFSIQRFLFEDGEKEGLGIGLDLFLGKNIDYTKLEQGTNTFAKYLTRTYDKKHLVRKVMDGWIEDKLGVASGDRLIDFMVFNGKKQYLLGQMIEEPDSILLEYTGDQLEWLSENEKQMWAFYFENDWFYTTDHYVIKRLTTPSPNTMALGMPTDAPGQTGTYLGWKIVESYMKRYPETTTKQLIQMDAQKLLEAAKYKP